MDYMSMHLLKQDAVIQADVGAVATLKQMAEMWGKAAGELEKSNGDFQAATNQLEPNWTDDSGTNFVGNARESGKTIDSWAKSIRDSQAQAKIEQVAGELPGTAAAVKKVVEQYKQILPFAALLGMTPEELELLFRPMAAAAMNKLAGTYQEATEAVSKARGGNWQGLSDDHPGATSVSDEDAQSIDVPMAQQGVFTENGGGDGGPSSWSSAQVQGEGTVSVSGSDPALSGGLGGAPVAPPSLPPVTPPPAAPALPVGGMPMAPGVSAFGGRGVAGGARVPGVRLGGPIGAQPVNSPAAPAPAAAPTVAQLTSATSATSTGVAGVPPMMPPMAGGMGAGGFPGGGIPGPGLARRRHRDGDDEPPTPGLPAMLSGKAGLPDAFRFSATRAEEPDAPGTVQLIDEDLWHDEAGAAVASGR